MAIIEYIYYFNIMESRFDLKDLYNFIVEATKSTYVGGGQEVEMPQRPGHTEYEYREGAFLYRDSYAGFTRSQGSEYVIDEVNGKVIWENGYGGGMVEGKEGLADICFKFLKEAMKAKDVSFQSFRGPKYFRSESFVDWEYKYNQDGDVERYSGREEIYYKGELVFFHEVSGGVVRET